MERWLGALEHRHLTGLRFAEVTRALRALSAAYVERRHLGAPRDALESAGKRAAFALFYGPLHFVTTTQVVRALDAASPLERIVDLGCGTGVAGSAWSHACSGVPVVLGIDRHPWATSEATWTYHQLGIRGHSRVGHVPAKIHAGRGDGVVAAYVLNELSEPLRRSLEQSLVEYAQNGARVLVIEPISRRAAPWWDDTAARLCEAGFRVDAWRFDIERPAIVAKFDTATRLNHRTLTVRSLYHP